MKNNVFDTEPYTLELELAPPLPDLLRVLEKARDEAYFAIDKHIIGCLIKSLQKATPGEAKAKP